jgi:hypothetical protein
LQKGFYSALKNISPICAICKIERLNDRRHLAAQGGDVSNPVGRPRDERREAYIRKYGLTYRRPARELSNSFLDQLDRCVDDSARRLLLEKGEVSAESIECVELPAPKRGRPAGTLELAALPGRRGKQASRGRLGLS